MNCWPERDTCSVHVLPSQYRSSNRPAGSAYQPAGTAGAAAAAGVAEAAVGVDEGTEGVVDAGAAGS